MNFHCYSIGHSNHPIEEFLNFLKKYQITTLIDVRSYPFSKYQPQFNQENLEKFLIKENISYRFFGKNLGGRYNDPKLQFPDGIVDYNKVRQRLEFQEGIKEVEKIIQEGNQVALMCSEKDPFDCHRALLISRVLDRDGIIVDHILNNGQIESQKSIEERLKNYYNNFSEGVLESLYERRNRDLFNKNGERNQTIHQKSPPENFTFSKYPTKDSDKQENARKGQKNEIIRSSVVITESVADYHMQTNTPNKKLVKEESNSENRSILKSQQSDEKSMRLFTIGFTQKSAQKFFDALSNNNVKLLIDVRLNNKSQLAGFTKAEDLKYFLKKICGIEYLHMPLCAPSEELLKKYQKKEIKWPEYEKEYQDILKKREVQIKFNNNNLNYACFLCSEPKPDQCHRRLLAEYLKQYFPEVEIIHL